MARQWDPIEAANEERDAAIEQRDDAQRTWQKTESKYEKTLATNLELRSKIEQDSKDIPWLKQRLSEFVEETNTQHGAIEVLEAIKRKYDKLSKQVTDYGLSAGRPEYQKWYEEAKRNLEFTNNSLQDSRYYAKGLEEKLQTQLEKPYAEIKWLRARLRRNARSTAYWARYRQHADDPEFRPAWGVRCACTEPDIGYSLKDQGPKIDELSDTVARLLGKILNTTDASRQKLEELRVEKEAADRTATKAISDLNHTLSESRKDLTDARQERANIQRELGQQKAKVQELRSDIAGKDVEIRDLESANLEMAEQPSLEAAENIRLLTIANTNLNELRRENAEYKKQSETQIAKIGEWEAAGREFDASVEAKDHRIAELEQLVNNAQSQTRSNNDAIYKKDKDYKELYDHYYIVLGEKQDAVDKYNGDVKTFNTMQKGFADREHELTKQVRVLQGQLADSRTKLQQAKSQTNPLQEMQLKEREVAVKAKEDALKKGTDPMENDQQGSNSGGLEMEDLERRLAAANEEIINVKNRNRAISGQLTTEKKERSEEKARHEKLLKQEQENAKTKCDVLRIKLEKEHPLKRVVSKLQDELINFREEAEKRK